ncbi:hypothetical protein NEAUS04_2624, partial [Nematocida ausubeli]
LCEKTKRCRLSGSNQGPLDLQSNALPTELSRHINYGWGVALQILGIVFG